MPIHVDWDSTHHRVILYKFLGNWTWTEFAEAAHTEQTIAPASGHQRYDVIGDFSESSALPRGPGISIVYRALRAAPKHRGCTIAVTKNNFMLAMVHVLTRVYPDAGTSFKSTDSLEKAYVLIEQLRTGAEVTPAK